MTEYRSILIKVTLCREGGEGLMEMVAWKRAESTLYLSSTVNRSSSTEYSWPSVCGSSVASWTSASFNGWHIPRGSRKVSVSFNIALGKHNKIFSRSVDEVGQNLISNIYMATSSMLLGSTFTLPFRQINTASKEQV